MSFGIFVESSHSRGMGHLYRMISFANFLKIQGEKFHLFINNDKNSIKTLEKQYIHFEIVDYNDFNSNWETDLINQYSIKYWLNDRFETSIEHTKKIKENNIILITFDENTSGATLCDLNICSLPCRFDTAKGNKVLKGHEFLILNPEIDNYKRQRIKQDKTLVTLGGSDTYGATLIIAKYLKSIGKKATIVIGPSFLHKEELKNISDGYFEIKESVPSLIKEFYNYDLAITGGGITPFEANAAGLPCIIIANELHEVENAKYLEKLGSSVFNSYYKEFSNINFDVNIKLLSQAGLNKINTNDLENVYREIKNL